MNEDISIFNEELVEFEYEGFSVFHDPARETWFLETDEDDENRKEIVLENSEGKIDFSDESLGSINFSEEELERLKSFLKDKK